MSGPPKYCLKCDRLWGTCNCVSYPPDSFSGGTLKQNFLDAFGYSGGIAAWYLWREAKKGALQKMLDATVKGSYGAKIGGVALICTGAGGVLTSVGCALHALIGGAFLTDVVGCWNGVLLGAAAVGAGFVALDFGHKAAVLIETTKAAAVLQVAISPEPPTPTPGTGIEDAEIAKALGVVTAPPILETPVPVAQRRTGL